MKVNRNYDLLGRVAKEIYPVTPSEKKCRHEQEGMSRVRGNVIRRIEKHMALRDDGLIIRIKR